MFLTLKLDIGGMNPQSCITLPLGVTIYHLAKVINNNGECKARYAVLFQIRMFPPEPKDEAHIGPTAAYDEVIYPGFQHDITALHITRIQHLIQSAYKCLITLQQGKIHVWVQTTNRCLVAKVKHTKPMYTRVQALRPGTPS